MQMWAHQTEALNRAKNLDGFALFFEPGCGKTATTIKILEEKYLQDRQVLKTLIISPLIVVKQWMDEFKKFSTIPHDYLIPLLGTSKEKQTTFKNRVMENSVVSVNYEGLLSEDLYKLLLKWKPDCLVIDESHKIKTHNSQRSKKVFTLSINSRYRYLLSGTPVLNSPADLYSQLLVLDHGKRLGNNFYRFQNHYFFDANSKRKGQAGYFPMWKPRFDTAENLKNVISDISMTVKKNDVLELPPFIQKTVEVELSKEQRQVYTDLKADFVAYLEDKACVAELAITKALRLQQIVSGFVVFDDGTVKNFDDTPRLDALSEILEEVTPSSKVIIWSVFKQDYENIRQVCKKLKVQFTELHGGVKDKEKNVEKFRRDDACKVLIGHPGSGGIGVNLVEAGYAIFYSRNFSLEFDIQAEARNYRGGSIEAGHGKITRIDLVAKNTIDDIILKAISFKKSQSEKILGSGFSDNEILQILKQENPP